jgi:caspase domain-containing protein
MAILVGCSRYLELPGLPAVSAGLVDLQAALTDPLTGGFTPGTCHVIGEPRDGGRLARTLLEAARATEDTLLVYYAGHGVLDEDNHLHLALAGTSSDQALVPDTALAFDRVRAILRASPARNRIVVLDCCFAGRAIHDMTGPALSAKAVITGSYVLTATDADKTARGSDGARHTAFTGALLDLLHAGIPEGPELLTLEAIYPHLRQALLARGLPEPRRQGTDTAAGLALARNRTPGPVPVPEPPRIPAQLQPTVITLQNQSLQRLSSTTGGSTSHLRPPDPCPRPYRTPVGRRRHTRRSQRGLRQVRTRLSAPPGRPADLLNPTPSPATPNRRNWSRGSPRRYTLGPRRTPTGPPAGALSPA